MSRRIPRRIAAVFAAARSVRARVVGLVLLLVTLGFVTAGLGAYLVESERIDARIERLLAQEIEEFEALAEDMLDPRTGKPVPSIARLLREAMQRNVPAENERILGFVHGKVRFFQGEQGTGVPLRDDPEFLAAVREVLPGSGYGTVSTAAGEVRFAVQPVRQGNESGAYVVAYFTAAEYAEFAVVVRTFVLLALCTLVLVAVAAWLSTGRLLRPLHQLGRTAAEINESDLTRRIEVTGNDDISRLAHTFNQMLDRLEGAFVAQRQFLDDAGHELRTPITIARGHLELLQAEDVDDVATTRTLVLDELDRMGRLVEELVSLAKAQRPDYLRPETVELGSFTDELFTKARSLGEHDWRLESRAEGSAVLDAQRVTQAIVQLADNAARHTHDRGVIALGTAARSGRIRLWVRDTGTGVPAGQEDGIFRRFERGEASSTASGSGLGLSIVAAIASAHGGEVELDNKPGWGAMFTVVIPMREPLDEPTEAPLDRVPETDVHTTSDAATTSQAREST